MAELIRLRDLPGMQRIIELSANRKQHDRNQRNLLDDEADELSIRLFRITLHDTYLSYDEVEDDSPDAISDEEWERCQQFEMCLRNCDLPFEQARPFWESIGWDVSDGQGDEMRGAHLFLRQIIAVASGVIEDATFHPAADGKPEEREVADFDAQIQSMERGLEAEAQSFLARRRK